MLNVPIREMMETSVITVTEDSPLTVAEEKMRTHGIRHLPVVNANGQLTGLFTHRDLYRILPSRLTEKDPVDTSILKLHTLKEVMGKEPETLTPEDPVSRAVALMQEKKYGCVPILDPQKRVVGILTAIDILHFAVHFLK